MRLLTLDQSTSTGWAKFSAGAYVGSGVKKIKGHKQEYGKLGAEFRDWLRGEVETFGPDRVIYETPVTSTKKKNHHGARILLGIPMVIEIVCADFDVEVLETNAQQWRTWLCGRFRAPKEIVGDSLRKKWIKEHTVKCIHEKYNLFARDFDEADAIGIGLYHLRNTPRDRGDVKF